MADLPIASLDPSAAWHPDADAAAFAAFKTLPKDITGKRTVESAGVLYSNDNGEHSYSAPITQNQHDGFGLRAQVQKGHKIAGIYHNHPGDDGDGQVFSPNDIAVANQLKVPSYIYFEHDGTVRKYVPGQTQTTTRYPAGSRNPVKVSRGDPVNLPTPALAATLPTNAAQPASPSAN